MSPSERRRRNPLADEERIQKRGRCATNGPSGRTSAKSRAHSGSKERDLENLSTGPEEEIRSSGHWALAVARGSSYLKKKQRESRSARRSTGRGFHVRHSESIQQFRQMPCTVKTQLHRRMNERELGSRGAQERRSCRNVSTGSEGRQRASTAGSGNLSGPCRSAGDSSSCQKPRRSHVSRVTAGNRRGKAAQFKPLLSAQRSLGMSCLQTEPCCTHPSRFQAAQPDLVAGMAATRPSRAPTLGVSVVARTFRRSMW